MLQKTSLGLDGKRNKKTTHLSGFKYVPVIRNQNFMTSSIVSIPSKLIVELSVCNLMRGSILL